MAPSLACTPAWMSLVCARSIHPSPSGLSWVWALSFMSTPWCVLCRLLSRCSRAALALRLSRVRSRLRRSTASRTDTFITHCECITHTCAHTHILTQTATSLVHAERVNGATRTCRALAAALACSPLRSACALSRVHTCALTSHTGYSVSGACCALLCAHFRMLSRSRHCCLPAAGTHNRDLPRFVPALCQSAAVPVGCASAVLASLRLFAYACAQSFCLAAAILHDSSPGDARDRH